MAQEKKVDAPMAPDVAKLQDNNVTVSVVADGTIYLQGREVPNAEAVEWGIRALLEGRKTEKGRTVIFRCDRSVSKDVFEPVIEAIAGGGGLIAAVGQKREYEYGGR